MGSVSLIQTNAGLPFTSSPSKLIKEDPFFINPRYISYLEANSVKNHNFFTTGIVICEQ